LARSVWLPGQSQRLENSRHEFDDGANIRGEFPPSFTFLVNNVAFKTAYFLADGIYPALDLFIKTIRNAMSPKDKRYESAQKPYGRMLSGRFQLLSLVGTISSNLVAWLGATRWQTT
jgi:hypothetical protein